MGQGTLSISELFEQWRADQRIIEETPTGKAADSHVIGRIVEAERDIGRTHARTLGEIILKARVIQAWRGIRPDHMQAIADSLVADLDLLFALLDEQELPAREKRQG